MQFEADFVHPHTGGIRIRLTMAVSATRYLVVPVELLSLTSPALSSFM